MTGKNRHQLLGIRVFGHKGGPLCELDPAVFPGRVAEDDDAAALQHQQPERSPPGTRLRFDDIGGGEGEECYGQHDRQPASALRGADCQRNEDGREDEPKSRFEQVAEREKFAELLDDSFGSIL